MYERFARWCFRRYGNKGSRKAVWAWLVECVLGHYRPHSRQRDLFLGIPDWLDGLPEDDS